MGRVFSLSRRAPRSPETGARAGPHRGHHAPTPYLAQGAGARSWCRCPGVYVGTCALDSRAVIPPLEDHGLKRTPESRRSDEGSLSAETHSVKTRPNERPQTVMMSACSDPLAPIRAMRVEKILVMSFMSISIGSVGGVPAPALQPLNPSMSPDPPPIAFIIASIPPAPLPPTPRPDIAAVPRGPVA